MTDAKEIATAAIEGIKEKKGQEIVLLDLNQLDDPICQYMVIAEAPSTRQLEAIQESVRDQVKARCLEKPVWDDKGSGEWIAIDYISVMVHLFLPKTRAYYRLEELWEDAQQTLIPPTEASKQ